MVWTIARKELTEMFRDGRFVAAAAIVLVLLLAAVGAGWKHYSDVHAQHSRAQQETREQWLDQGEKNPHSAAHYGVYAFKPKTHLSMIDTGVDPYTGVAVWLEAHYQNQFLHRPAQDATAESCTIRRASPPSIPGTSPTEPSSRMLGSGCGPGTTRGTGSHWTRPCSGSAQRSGPRSE
jgi:hypothetical protein